MQTTTIPTEVVQKAYSSCDAASGCAHKDGNSIRDPYVRGKSRINLLPPKYLRDFEALVAAYTQIRYSAVFGGVTHFEGSIVQLVERFTGL